MKNFAEMMKQAQALQGRMADMQAELERTLIEGRSGGGMVTVTLSGKGDMAGVKIDPSLLSLGCPSGGSSRSTTPGQEGVKNKVTGGLPLPPGLSCSMVFVARTGPRLSSYLPLVGRSDAAEGGVGVGGIARAGERFLLLSSSAKADDPVTPDGSCFAVRSLLDARMRGHDRSVCGGIGFYAAHLRSPLARGKGEGL
jgi:hypothetical protein